MPAPLISVEEALLRVLGGVTTLPAEEIPIDAAHGRVLAATLASRRTQPPADLSSMDGYAVAAADLAEPTARLRVIGESAAGRPFQGNMKSGEAVRIFTGAVMPAGADQVVPQENVAREADDITINTPPKGKFVRRQGFDFKAGQVMLEAGRRLNARDIGLTAAMDHARIMVSRRPRVAIIATGDELVEPGGGDAPDKIVASNPVALSALVRQEGGEPIALGIFPDRTEAIGGAIRSAGNLDVDLLLTIGGASVGDHDLIAPALTQEGFVIAFHRMAMRPGRPMLLGVSDKLRAIGLPGNPVSAFVCAFLFLVPLLRKMQGRTDALPQTESALLGRAVDANDHRQDFLRAKFTRRGDGQLIATPFKLQDSSMLAVLHAADGLVIRVPHAPAAPEGAPCDVLRFTD
ncbi:MAG TPA: gephyrin-like molybdotransferase Glp [Xanthobacteraceae bacterium]|nr:gephyrin-like molybdotransferase Glp [Xanthobacteraceae bacterium]